MSKNKRIAELEPIEKEVLRMKRDLEERFKHKDIPEFDKKVLRELADECLKFIDMIQRRVEFLGEYV